MMRQKGFTLIELLAVIVILAIISLVAIPLIINVVEEAKKNIAISSTLSYIDAIEKQIEINNINGNNNIPTDGIERDVEFYKDKVKATGKVPKDGTITIGNQGKVVNYSVQMNEYIVESLENILKPTARKINSNNGETIYKPKRTIVVGATHNGIVYLDPTDLTNECDESNSKSKPGTKKGCMKFYIFDDSNNEYKMILDHNIKSMVAWNSSGVNASMLEVEETLIDNTDKWVGNPRLITANEIAKITKADTEINWNESTATHKDEFYFDGIGDKKQEHVATNQGENPYAWLFDYTYSCASYGCDIESGTTYGYWTSSTVSDKTNKAWAVRRNGSLEKHDVDSTSSYGIRPVITLSKSQIN